MDHSVAKSSARASPGRVASCSGLSTGRALCPAALLLLLAATILPAQTVAGTVVDSATGVPMRGTVMLLIDSTGARRSAALVDSLGRFILRAPAPGTYRVRTQQIGIASKLSAPMVLGATTPVQITVRVSPIRLTLPTVVTEVQERCAATGGGASATDAAAPLWDEALKALTATTIAPSTGTTATTVTLRNFVRELDPRTLRVRRAESREVIGSAQAPYASLAPDTLAKYGFVVQQGGETIYNAPDARTLISDAFLAGHCLRARPADRAHPGLVGVAFEPVPGKRGADIRGTLWLDVKSSALRDLEYTYTGQSAAVPDSLAGGRLSFAPLPSGAWIVSNWVIRMPKFASAWGNNGLGRYAVRGATDSVLAAVVETGGDIVAAGAAANAPAIVSAPERSVPSARAVVYGSVLSDPKDAPVMNAEVVVSPEYTARSDTAGQFRIAEIPPGKYTLVVRHLGYGVITLPLVLAPGDTLARDFVLTPVVPALDIVRVTGRPPPPSVLKLGKMTDYANRRLRGFGRAVDSATLRKESYRQLGDILRDRFPVTLLPIEGSSYIASRRGLMAIDPAQQIAGDRTDQKRGAKPACYAQVYLDGVLVYRPVKDAPLFDVNSISPSTLQAAEFFPGASETPREYGGTGAACGTLILWTK